MKRRGGAGDLGGATLRRPRPRPGAGRAGRRGSSGELWGIASGRFSCGRFSRVGAWNSPDGTGNCRQEKQALRRCCPGGAVAGLGALTAGFIPDQGHPPPKKKPRVTSRAREDRRSVAGACVWPPRLRRSATAVPSQKETGRESGRSRTQVLSPLGAGDPAAWRVAPSSPPPPIKGGREAKVCRSPSVSLVVSLPAGLLAAFLRPLTAAAALPGRSRFRHHRLNPGRYRVRSRGSESRPGPRWMGLASKAFSLFGDVNKGFLTGKAL